MSQKEPATDGDSALQEFISSAESVEKLAGGAEIVITDFDAPVPDANDGFPETLFTDWNSQRDNDREDAVSVFSEYSLISNNHQHAAPFPSIDKQNGGFLGSNQNNGLFNDQNNSLFNDSQVDGLLSGQQQQGLFSNQDNDGLLNGQLNNQNNNALFANQSNPQTGLFLEVPSGNFGRRRSPSIGSSNGLSLDINYGALSPFPGATVVQVPSPWIQTIHSPAHSTISEWSPLDNTATFEYPQKRERSNSVASAISFVDFNDFLASHNYFSNSMENNAESPMMNSTGSLESINSQAGDLPLFELVKPNPSSSNNEEPLFVLHDEHTDETVKDKLGVPKIEVEANSKKSSPIDKKGKISTKEILPHPSVKNTVPDGKFWNVVKKDGHTLYQCPFDDCLKSMYFTIESLSNHTTKIAFTRPYNLKSHYRAHTGEKPYICDEPGCDSAFARKHDLKRHMKLHRYTFFLI